jgi:hypothetical protein
MSKELIFDTKKILNLMHYRSEKTNWVAVMPSKVLLLGFVCLGLRILRSWVMPSDIVQWCHRGVIPFLSIADLLQSESASSRDILRRFPAVRRMMDGHSGGYIHYVLSPSSVFFHSCMLASVLGMQMPPLNTPLAAAATTLALGLPTRPVWDNLTRMMRLLRAAAPHDRLASTGVHHQEHVVVLVAVACRLCPSWMDWKWHREAMPATSHSIQVKSEFGSGGADADGEAKSKEATARILQRPPEQLMRCSPGELRAVLSALSSVTRPLSTSSLNHLYPGYFSFNRTVKKLFESVTLLAGRGGGGQRSTSSETALSRDPGCLVGPEPAPTRKKKRKKRLPPDAPKVRWKPKSKLGRDQRLYMTYCSGQGEGGGAFHPQYVCLVERLAAMLCCPPGLLHTLLHLFDEALVAEVADKAASEGEEVEEDRLPTFSTTSEAMANYTFYYDTVMPAVQTLGRELAAVVGGSVGAGGEQHPQGVAARVGLEVETLGADTSSSLCFRRPSERRRDRGNSRSGSGSRGVKRSGAALAAADSEEEGKNEDRGDGEDEEEEDPAAASAGKKKRKKRSSSRRRTTREGGEGSWKPFQTM